MTPWYVMGTITLLAYIVGGFDLLVVCVLLMLVFWGAWDRD